MTYNFFLIDRVDAQDGTRVGYAYAKENKDKWISVDSGDVGPYITVGFVKGCDFVVYEDKVYGIMKSYTDLSDRSTLLICVESIAGCDNKKVFRNINNSSIIVDKKKKDDEEENSEDAGE